MEMNHKTTIKQYLPLIVIFACVIALTIFKQILMPPWSVYAAMRDFMGFFFLIFGGLKLINLAGFAQAYAQYDLIAKRSTTYALAYPFIEITLGLAYLFGFYLPIINVITIVLMSINSVGVIQAIRSHGAIQCACLGTFFTIPLTWVTLAEDLLMALMALIMLLI